MRWGECRGQVVILDTSMGQVALHFHLEAVRSCSFGGKHPGLLLPVILGHPLSFAEVQSSFRKGKLSF